MTCPAVIQGVEQWSRWSNLNHRPLLLSEGSENRSRLPKHGIRLLPFLRYGFIVLALVLLLSDTFRLAFTPNSSQDVSRTTESVRSARTVQGPTHTRSASRNHRTGA